MLTMDAELAGYHNSHWDETRGRLLQASTYRDCSTIIITPAIGDMAFEVHMSQMSLIRPMNQKVTTFGAYGAEVADAYNNAVRDILAHPEVSQWKYILTLEVDNTPPPDGLLKLIEDIETACKCTHALTEHGKDGSAPCEQCECKKHDAAKYDAVGGIYFTKGEGGMPMAYGDARKLPPDFIPWLPPLNTVSPCHALGMGFTLFRMSYFKDERFNGEWFRTVNEWTPGVGASGFTQDLWHFQQAGRLGYRFAVSTRVLVGHFDKAARKPW